MSVSQYLTGFMTGVISFSRSSFVPKVASIIASSLSAVWLFNVFPSIYFGPQILGRRQNPQRRNTGKDYRTRRLWQLKRSLIRLCNRRIYCNDWVIFVAKWALITGASSGLGEEFAWQLAAEPLNVVLVARRQDRLEALAQRIHTTLGVETEVLVEDLSTKAGQYAVIRRLRDDSRPVAVLVNNAGFGLGQTFVGGKWDREDEALEVMVRALCRLTFEGAQAMGSRCLLYTSPSPRDS